MSEVVKKKRALEENDQSLLHRHEDDTLHAHLHVAEAGAEAGEGGREVDHGHEVESVVTQDVMIDEGILRGQEARREGEIEMIVEKEDENTNTRPNTNTSTAVDGVEAGVETDTKVNVAIEGDVDNLFFIVKS
eukprot:m.43790 g.43790  ORF g.43790 m.43790 type:complete len:133 (-) comp10568_c0_seq11:475-873(-)